MSFPEDPPPPTYGADGPKQDDNAAYAHEPALINEKFGATGFDNDTVRKRFVKKVCSIVGIQLLVTFGLVLGATLACPGEKISPNNITNATINECVDSGIYQIPLVLASMIGCTVSLVAMACSSICCAPIFRKTPYNFIFLTVWTLMMAHMISFIGLGYDRTALVLAMGTTAFVVMTVSGLMWLTPFDFSKVLMVMIIVALGWIFIVMVTLIVRAEWSDALYASIGVTIYTIYLAVDLQIITGGLGRRDHRYFRRYLQLGEDDYILGAILIYLDIINIFSLFLRELLLYAICK